MVFNENLTVIIFCVVIFAWLAVLTFIHVRTVRHYNRLSGGISKSRLTEILESILSHQKELKHQVAEIQKRIEVLEADAQLHIARIGIVRFNPFADTGGAQSLTLALLDNQNNGIVMTSLYSRTANRWYVKEVRAGKGKDFELSKEEEAAIKKARSFHTA